MLLLQLGHRPNAAGAGVDRLGAAVLVDGRLLNVRAEDTVGALLGEADVVSERERLAAHLTYTGHRMFPLPCFPRLQFQITDGRARRYGVAGQQSLIIRTRA